MKKALIIGAGFSRPFGLPLAAEVIPWLWSRWQNDDDDPFLAETRLETEFWINQAKACGMIETSVDFEAFLAFLESAESLWDQLRQSRYLPGRPADWPEYVGWPSNPGDVAKTLERRFLGEVLHVQDPISGGFDCFRPAVDFVAQLLEPGDAVLTFNFDSIVERSLFWAFGRGSSSEGKPGRDKVSVYHLHGAAEWKLYELIDGRDDDPESTIHLFQHHRKTWKLRRIGGEFGLNPYKNYAGLKTAAVQMVPYKSIPWFLASQWEHGLKSLRGADYVMIIGYSFPIHDSVARLAIRTTLSANSRAKVVNVDPRAADPKYQRAMVSLLGRTVEFMEGSWCDFIK